MTDWIAGGLLRVAEDGSFEQLADLPMGSADLSYVPGQRLAVVPLMLEDRVIALRVD